MRQTQSVFGFNACRFLPLRVGGSADPLSVCLPPNPASEGSAVPAPGWSCALKPELHGCVVIPAGETALALSGALSQRAARVSAGLSGFSIHHSSELLWQPGLRLDYL